MFSEVLQQSCGILVDGLKIPGPSFSVSLIMKINRLEEETVTKAILQYGDLLRMDPVLVTVTSV